MVFALLTFEYPFELVMVRGWTNKVVLLVAFVSIQHLQANSSTFKKKPSPSFPCTGETCISMGEALFVEV